MKLVRSVLMTADAVSGVWTYAMRLAKHYSQHGTRTILAVMTLSTSILTILAPCLLLCIG